MTTLDTTKPAGSESPRLLDDYERQTRLAFQERLDVDHFFHLTGSLLDEIAAGAGKHRQVTFQAPLDEDPVPLDGEALLYTKSVDDVAEVFAACDGVDGDPVQVTKAGQLCLTLAAMNALFDGETIQAIVDPDDAEVTRLAIPLDGVTLEYEDVGKTIRIKTPDKTAAMDELCVPVMIRGHYQGNGSAAPGQDIDLGIEPYLVLIKRVDAATDPVLGINAGGAFVWFNSGTGSILTVPAAMKDAHTITLKSEGGYYTNKAATPYAIFAIGKRI